VHIGDKKRQPEVGVGYYTRIKTEHLITLVGQELVRYGWWQVAGEPRVLECMHFPAPGGLEDVF